MLLRNVLEKRQIIPGDLVLVQFAVVQYIFDRYNRMRNAYAAWLIVDRKAVITHH